MRGINYLLDEKGNKTALLIDLKRRDKRVSELLEDIEDLMHAESVKGEASVPFEKAITNLFRKGKVSKKIYQKIIGKNV